MARGKGVNLFFGLGMGGSPTRDMWKWGFSSTFSREPVMSVGSLGREAGRSAIVVSRIWEGFELSGTKVRVLDEVGLRDVQSRWDLQHFS